MATYKGIKGFKVDSLTSDPTTTGSVGQFYYNSTSDAFKYVQPGGAPAGTWSSGGTMNTARYRMMGGAGSLSAGVVMGGATPDKANVEEYNGSSWTTVTAYPSAQPDIGVCGVQTLALCVGGGSGSGSNLTFEYDGTNFSAGGDYPTIASRVAVCGVQTAALAIGGQTPGSPTYVNNTFEYNGSSWTAGGNYPAVTVNGAASGTQTAALKCGGGPGNQTSTNTYNGTAWTTVNSMNTGKGEMGGSGNGTQTSSLAFQGAPVSNSTEFYDGTSWTEVADLATSRSSMGSFGTGTEAMAAGGTSPGTGTIATTEEWVAPDLVIKTVTTS